MKKSYIIPQTDVMQFRTAELMTISDPSGFPTPPGGSLIP